MTDQLDHEREFWDAHAERILGDPDYNFQRPKLGGFEQLAREVEYLGPVAAFWGPIRGKRILDLACGDGWISLSLGKSGAEVYGCDISPKLIEVGTRFARANHLDGQVKFDSKVAEEIDYPNDFFDLVIMHAALHHCDIERTSQQVWRVLKPGGKAVFIEDYAYHPLMNLYRRLTPGKHTETEEALTDEDLRAVVSRFSSHEYRYHGLLNLVETRSHPLLKAARALLRMLDRHLYRYFPGLKRYSQLVEILVVK